MRRKIPVFVLLTFLVFGGCSTTTNIPRIDEEKAKIEARLQRISAFEMSLEHTRKLENVSFPILRSNVSLCGDKTKETIGIVFITLDHFKDDGWKETAREEFGIGERLTIIAVAEGSPAHNAGLLVGDRIDGVNRTLLGTGKKAAKKFSELMRKYKYHKSVVLNIEREGKKQDITVEPVLQCDYRVDISSDNSVNAWANGHGVLITTGMMRFVESDDDLALIVGHELAHNTCGHIKKKKGNILLGRILGSVITYGSGIDLRETGALAGAQAFSQSFEAEADYVGTYFTSRAGFDANKAASLWRRMGEAHPGAIYLKGSSHPSTAKRFLAIKKTVEEINRKKEKGLLLIPNPKKN